VAGEITPGRPGCWIRSARSCTSPLTINIDRMPQWGRSFESFSEDPVYYAWIPVDPAKTIESVTLPDNFGMHVFAMALGS
jgi:hypothetical protein